MTDTYYGFAREPFTFDTPRFRLGWGVLSELEQFFDEFGIGHAFLVTDQGLTEAGLVARMEEVVQAADVELTVFNEVEPEPSIRTTQAVADLIQETAPDGVIGFGGGSCLDVAKAASSAAAQRVPVRDCLGMDNVPGPALTKILIPTTAGTSSEITQVCVLTDEDHRKRVMYSRYLLADLALIDPELMELPPKITAASGLDALTHVVESYVTTVRNPVSDLCAERAIRLIASNLRTATLNGKNSPEARYNMSLAATIGGMAFANSGVGAVHGLSLPFGAACDVPHGEANAILLPHVMRYNVPADVTRYADIARWFGVAAENGTPEAIARCGVDEVEQLVRDCGFEPSLSSYGVQEDDIPDFADTSLEVQSHNLARNPRQLTREDLITMYERAL